MNEVSGVPRYFVWEGVNKFSSGQRAERKENRDSGVVTL
jgi:hypothetical protein